MQQQMGSAFYRFHLQKMLACIHRGLKLQAGVNITFKNNSSSMLLYVFIGEIVFHVRLAFQVTIQLEFH